MIEARDALHDQRPEGRTSNDHQCVHDVRQELFEQRTWEKLDDRMQEQRDHRARHSAKRNREKCRPFFWHKVDVGSYAVPACDYRSKEEGRSERISSRATESSGGEVGLDRPANDVLPQLDK